MQCQTVRIKSDVSNENPSGFIVINEEDFVEGEMELYVEPQGATTSNTNSTSTSAPTPPWSKAT